ncbi:hypothetical protein ACIBSV_23395 [Embleya sp. NPDC050154]
MTHHASKPCPDCGGHARAHVVTGGTKGNRTTRPVNCATCGGTGSKR